MPAGAATVYTLPAPLHEAEDTCPGQNMPALNKFESKYLQYELNMFDGHKLGVPQLG